MVKLFQLRRKSLFGQILDWMLTPLLLLLPLSVMLSWVVAESIAGRPFDRGLEHNVKALVQLVKTDQQRLLFNLPSPAREILRADDTDVIYYQVLGTRGEFLSGERDLPQRLAAAHLVIARSGASTVAELATVGRPSILVPYPYAADDHQMANARAFEAAGVCAVFIPDAR